VPGTSGGVFQRVEGLAPGTLRFSGVSLQGVPPLKALKPYPEEVSLQGRSGVRDRIIE
jgi:hypothetical protein